MVSRKEYKDYRDRIAALRERAINKEMHEEDMRQSFIHLCDFATNMIDAYLKASK